MKILTSEAINCFKVYNLYRKVLKDLHAKILDECVSQNIFFKAAKMLGLVENGQVCFDYQIDEIAVYEFAIYEKFQKGATCLNKYIRKNIDCSEDEQFLLQAMTKAKTSLFQVVEIKEEESIVILQDVLNGSKTFRIMDLSMSKIGELGLLFFARLLKFSDNAYMTVGTCYAFMSEDKDLILLKANRLMRKYNNGDVDANRKRIYFQVDRELGIHLEHLNG